LKNLINTLALSFCLFLGTAAQSQDSATATSTATTSAEVSATPSPTPSVTPAVTAEGPGSAALLNPTDNTTVPLDDVANAAFNLAKDHASLGKLGLAMALINLIAMLLKTDAVGGWFSKAHPLVKRAVLLGLGQVAGILLAVEGGAGVTAAIFGGLITSGGAVALFEAVKPLLPAKYQTLL
jgi:hypothetical protein